MLQLSQNSLHQAPLFIYLGHNGENERCGMKVVSEMQVDFKSPFLYNMFLMLQKVFKP